MILTCAYAIVWGTFLLLPLAAIVAGDCLLGVLAGDLSLTVDGGGLAAVLGGGVGVVATPIGGDEMDAGEEVRLYLPSLP